MRKLLIILGVLVVGFTLWDGFNNPFPQLTVEEMNTICIEEGIY